MLTNVGWLYLNLKEQFREVSANERRAYNLLPMRTELTFSSISEGRTQIVFTLFIIFVELRGILCSVRVASTCMESNPAPLKER